MAAHSRAVPISSTAGTIAQLKQPDVRADTDATATTEYRIDGGSWQTGTTFRLRIPIRHKAPGLPPGPHPVEHRSTDVAGNVETIRSFTLVLY